MPGQIKNLKLRISAGVSGASMVIQHISAEIPRRQNGSYILGATQELFVPTSLD